MDRAKPMPASGALLMRFPSPVVNGAAPSFFWTFFCRQKSRWGRRRSVGLAPLGH